MTRSQRIKTIVKLKNHRERHAARSFAASQLTLANIRKRIQQLLEYREEYLQFFQSDGKKLSIKSIRDQQAFILQLDQGIAMLRQQLRIQEKMNDRERQNWIQQKQQLDTMQNIHDRCFQAEQQLRELRTQHTLDELATNRASRT